MLALGSAQAVFFPMPVVVDCTLKDILCEACVDLHGRLGRTNPNLKAFLSAEFSNRRLRGIACYRGLPPRLLPSNTPLQPLLGHAFSCIAFVLDDEDSESETTEGTLTDAEGDAWEGVATQMEWEAGSTVEGVTHQLGQMSLY